jgi:glycosyltransferase involved in cell wall biosynthesis
MTRVILDSGNSRPTSGVGIYTSSLFEGLRVHAADSVVAETSTISDGRTSLRPLWRLRYFWRLRAAVAEGFGGADVVHFTNVFVPDRSARCAYVATVHDLEPLLFPHVTTRRYVAYYRWAVERALHSADIVLTDTAAVRSQILERYPWSEEKVRVCGIGLSPVFAQAVDRTPTAPRTGPRVLLFVGSFTKKKNAAWLTRAVSRGVQSGELSNFRLILAGQRGHGTEEVEKAVGASRGTATIVHGPSLAELASLYRRADAVILPSHTEGFGIPLIEAAYCGVPVVASAIPTSLEVAAGFGEFFQPGDETGLFAAIRGVLDDRTSAARHSAMRECIRRYSWEHLVPQYVAAYTEAMQRRTGRPAV